MINHLIRGVLLIALYACSVLPKNYETLIIGTWYTEQNIPSTSGKAVIKYTMTLNKNGEYSLKEVDPDTGTTIVNYQYIVGYYRPKPAIVLLDPISLEALKQPIFFMFSDNDSTLTTSENSSFDINKIWSRI